MAGVDDLFRKHADSVKVGLLGLRPALPQSRISTQLHNFQTKHFLHYLITVTLFGLSVLLLCAL